MKISIDGGALCSPLNNRFGNYIFTQNLLKTIAKYDKKNDYYFYTFCKKSINNLADNIHFQYLYPAKFWMSFRLSLEELIHKKDIFLALNQAIPLYTKARVLSFSHGLSFYFYPQFYPDSASNLKKQLKVMAQRSKKIIVSSSKVQEELAQIFPKFRNIEAIPFGIPSDMLEKPKVHPPSELEDLKYFLFVGMDHPIKNIDFICTSFKKFLQDKKFKDFRLYLVTSTKKYEDYHPNIKVFDRIDREKLKALYCQAQALLTASYYESFNLAVLEALSQGCQVIGLNSAIIPELQSYTHCVLNRNEFVERMLQVAKDESIKIDQQKLRQDFSWEKYIMSLRALY